MRIARVHLEDGTSYETSINGTDAEIKRYFERQYLNMGVGGGDRMVRCTRVDVRDGE